MDRPTFSENWYRIAELRLKLRSVVQEYRQDYRGQRWHLLRDPATNTFSRIDAASYAFVARLDGQRSVDRAWQESVAELGDDAPTQGEAVSLLGRLYQANLLQADVPPDAATLFERQRKRVRKEVGGYLKNILFARLPLFDPDPLLDRWMPIAGALFSPIGLAAWLGLMSWALVSLAGHGQSLWQQAQGVLSPSNLPLLYACMVAIKLAHELGHGFACKRFGRRDPTGGEVHTLGVMLMVFTPLPYVDASSCWALRSKWRRAAVAAAGMYVELAVAAVAAIVWVRATPGSQVAALSYNLLFIAGVSTVLFNANPLIRFDGYYILSDLLETPNLARRGFEYWQYLAKKHLFGVRRPRRIAHTAGERPLLLIYAVAALVYRVVLMVGIFLFVAEQLFFVAMVLTGISLAMWVLVPLGKCVRYLAGSPELARTRPRALAWSAGLACVLVAGVGLVPVPDRGVGQGVVEAAASRSVVAPVGGMLRHLPESGETIERTGAIVVRLENPRLSARLAEKRAEREVLRSRYNAALAAGEGAAAQSLLRQMAAVQKQIDHFTTREAAQRIEAPAAGVWWTASPAAVPGAWVQQGEVVGRVTGRASRRIRVAADQRLGPRVLAELPPGSRAEIRVRGEADITASAHLMRAMPGRRELPHEALGFAGGGGLKVQPDDPKQTRQAFFEVELAPFETTESEAAGRDATNFDRLRPGQVVMVRFTFEPAPIATQVVRYVRQMLQERLEGSGRWL